MGTIYDAFDRNIRRKVAIKSINQGAAQNSVSRKYFVKEAQITGQLEHPNIIRQLRAESLDEHPL